MSGEDEAVAGWLVRLNERVELKYVIQFFTDSVILLILVTLSLKNSFTFTC